MRPILGQALIPSLGARCGTVLNMILPVNTHPRRVTGDRYMVQGINGPSHFESNPVRGVESDARGEGRDSRRTSFPLLRHHSVEADPPLLVATGTLTPPIFTSKLSQLVQVDRKLVFNISYI